VSERLTDRGVARGAAPAAGTGGWPAPGPRLWRNLRLFDPALGLDRTADLLIDDGRIAGIGRGLPAAGATVHSGEGLIAFPGFLDLHCHLRDPGDGRRETAASGLRAAAAGGFVAVVAMANTDPPLDRPQQVAALLRRAAGVRGARLLPAAAATRGLEGQAPTDAAALAAAGAVALSDDGRTVGRADVMRAVLEGARRAGLPVLCHAEDPALTEGGVVGDGPVGRTLGLPLRPAVAEALAVARDLVLAADTGARLHLQHLTVGRAAAMVAAAKRAGVAVTAEVTPHHLTLTEDLLPRLGGLARVNPPLRPREEVEALALALATGVIDAVATDHAPHLPADKARPLAEAPPGFPGLETAVAVTYGLVRRGQLSLAALVDRLCYGPHRVLGRTAPRLAEGAAVAISLFAPEERWRVDPARLYTRCRVSPFADLELTGRPAGILLGEGEARP
jgi:dihydroorotase